MTVIPLTLVISLCLTATFIIFFIREHGRRRFSSAESDALLPLAEEHAHTASAKSDAPIALDLGGRRSAKPHLRRGCGRKHADGEPHAPCGDCEHRHDHHHT